MLVSLLQRAFMNSAAGCPPVMCCGSFFTFTPISYALSHAPVIR